MKYKSKKYDNYIYGLRAVIEAVNANRDLNKIMIQKGMQKDLFLELKNALKRKDYPLQFVPQIKLDTITEENHQGVIAIASPIEYKKLELLVDQWLEEEKKPCFLLLDRVTDVRNIGAIARSALCQNVDAIVIPSRGSAMVTSDAIKTSAGALNSLPVCKVDHLKEALFYLQQSGIKLVACTEKAKKKIYESDLTGAIGILLGSEEDGISNELLRMTDEQVKIPMYGPILSLNVSVSAGMILYERTRQNLFS